MKLFAKSITFPTIQYGLAAGSGEWVFEKNQMNGDTTKVVVPTVTIRIGTPGCMYECQSYTVSAGRITLRNVVSISSYEEWTSRDTNQSKPQPYREEDIFGG